MSLDTDRGIGTNRQIRGVRLMTVESLGDDQALYINGGVVGQFFRI